MKTNYNYLSSFLLVHNPCNDLDFLFIYFLYIGKKHIYVSLNSKLHPPTLTYFQVIHLSFIFFFFQSLA